MEEQIKLHEPLLAGCVGRTVATSNCSPTASGPCERPPSSTGATSRIGFCHPTEIGVFVASVCPLFTNTFEKGFAV